MVDRAIIIADTDAKFRSRMADFFRDEGYQVGTATTPDEVLARVLENQAAVLLLDSGFGGKVSSSELIHLLKKCNRHLHIIMVSETMSLSQARQVRQEGIFYHALKPETAADTNELWQAVACAIERHRASVLADPTASRKGLSGGTGPGKRLTAKALTGVFTLVVLLGASYYSLAAGTGNATQGNWSMLLFLGFCALIVVGQLLPIFRIKLPSRVRHGQAAQETTPRGSK